MLEVLIYLFETYLQPQRCAAVNPRQLTDRLLSVGFNTSDVERAVDWLERLSLPEEMPLETDLDAIRLYTEEECELLGIHGLRFIYLLENSKLLHPWTRELVLKRAGELGKGQLSPDVIRWLIFMVSLNLPSTYEVDLQSLAAILFEAECDQRTDELL